jgi:hypothetical protein
MQAGTYTDHGICECDGGFDHADPHQEADLDRGITRVPELGTDRRELHFLERLQSVKSNRSVTRRKFIATTAAAAASCLACPGMSYVIGGGRSVDEKTLPWRLQTKSYRENLHPMRASSKFDEISASLSSTD